MQPHADSDEIQSEMSVRGKARSENFVQCLFTCELPINFFGESRNILNRCNDISRAIRRRILFTSSGEAREINEVHGGAAIARQKEKNATTPCEMPGDGTAEEREDEA